MKHGPGSILIRVYFYLSIYNIENTSFAEAGSTPWLKGSQFEALMCDIQGDDCDAASRALSYNYCSRCLHDLKPGNKISFAFYPAIISVIIQTNDSSQTSKIFICMLQNSPAII